MKTCAVEKIPAPMCALIYVGVLVYVEFMFRSIRPGSTWVS